MMSGDIVITLVIIGIVAIIILVMVKAKPTEPTDEGVTESNSVLVGEARKIQWRAEQNPRFWATSREKIVDVCTFRLERFGPDGVPLQPVTVEIRSCSGFAGDLTEGDRVAVYYYTEPSGAVATSAVRNLSTGGIFGDRKKINSGDVYLPQSESSPAGPGPGEDGGPAPVMPP